MVKCVRVLDRVVPQVIQSCRIIVQFRSNTFRLEHLNSFFQEFNDKERRLKKHTFIIKTYNKNKDL
jgi:hypothetical protein